VEAGAGESQRSGKSKRKKGAAQQSKLSFDEDE
jgi:hypothetical protein